VWLPWFCSPPRLSAILPVQQWGASFALGCLTGERPDIPFQATPPTLPHRTSTRHGEGHADLYHAVIRNHLKQFALIRHRPSHMLKKKMLRFANGRIRRFQHVRPPSRCSPSVIVPRIPAEESSVWPLPRRNRTLPYYFTTTVDWRRSRARSQYVQGKRLG